MRENNDKNSSSFLPLQPYFRFFDENYQLCLYLNFYNSWRLEQKFILPELNIFYRGDDGISKKVDLDVPYRLGFFEMYLMNFIGVPRSTALD